MKRSNSILRAAFYARVSSEKQADANTIPSQLAELRCRIEQAARTIHEDDCFVYHRVSGTRQGRVNVLVQAPFGYRYVTIAEGGGQARYEVVLEEARIVRQLFTWVGQEHLSLSEVCRRLEKQQIPTRTGLPRWSPATVA